MFSIIFEVCPGAGQREAYLQYAGALKPELGRIDGLIDNERFASGTQPGWMLSHSTWRNEKSGIRWRVHARHNLTQDKGRSEVFADYHLRVGEVTADTRPPDGHRIVGQRFNATEVGAAKTCTIVEGMPSERAREGEPEVILSEFGLDGRSDGLIGWDAFGSITAPGKVLILQSWTDADAIAHVPSSSVADRWPTVRVVRDYEMTDLRESPQYNPDRTATR